MKKISLVPDLMLDDIHQITPEFLFKKEIRGVLFDIDNTLAPYETAIPDAKLCQYFASLQNAGIIIGLISNNTKERVDLFNKEFCFFSMHKARKPSPKSIKRFIIEQRLRNNQVLFVGDQIFTDCLAAHRAGVECVIVKPLSQDPGIFFKIKRYLEKPFVKIYKLKHQSK